MATEPKFPDVEVELDDGNAFFIIGRVSKALRKAGHGDKVDAFAKEARSGDYDHLLQVCRQWVWVS